MTTNESIPAAVATNKTQLLEQWRASLPVFREELGYLLWSRQIYRRLREILEANPAVQEPWTFHDWVIRNYVTAMVMAGCRLLDHKSQSFRKLLENMKSNPETITRQAYVDLLAEQDLEVDRLLKIPDRDFDHWAGAGADALGVDTIRADIDRLVAAWEPFKMLRDKQIAHRVPSESFLMPTYAELDSAIDTIHPVLKRYEVLLLATNTVEPEPVPDIDWDTIFTRPWLT